MAKLPKNFTWERGPFSQCALCGEVSFGFLSAGKKTMSLRCSMCGYQIDERLPEVNKKVLYFDQFVFSELFKIEAGTRRKDDLTDFWQELHRLVRRVVLLQQAILPHSDVHSHETIVSPWPAELRNAYESIGGDLSLLDTSLVQLEEVAEFALAFIEGRDPNLEFDVDRVLNGQRNEWLDHMRITVGIDYGKFADDIRAQRYKVDKNLIALMDHWRANKLGFDEVLDAEIQAFALSRRSAMIDLFERSELATQAGDVMAMVNLSMSSIIQEYSLLRRMFVNAGTTEDDLHSRISAFWAWERNSEMPSGRIFAYLFAGLAGQVANGRKKPATASFMNDVKAISAYAPFVDAMFIDKECFTILTQGRPAKELGLKSKIFSLHNRDELLDFLRKMESEATDEVRAKAKRIYGLE